PVPAEPTLGVSSTAMFAALAGRTQPTFQLNFAGLDECSFDFPSNSEDDVDADFDTDWDSDAPPSVTVVGEARVGPYDTVTLQATSSAALLTWLNDAGYTLPSNLDPLLAPYV